MIITIDAVKSFTFPRGKGEGTISLPVGGTVRTAYRELGITGDHPKPPIPFVNGEKSSLDSLLHEGDVLFLFYPLNGG